MVFTSLEFLFLYFAVTMIFYFIVPLKLRNIVLLIVSLIFYGWGEPRYVVIMIVSMVVDYICGYFAGKYRESNKKKARRFVIASAVINLGILGFFKYYTFIVQNLQLLPFAFLKKIPLLADIPLPIGISFYTFQILSYVVDVKRGSVAVQRSFARFLLYVTLFPQLIAGPIVRYSDVEAELSDRTVDAQSVFYGLYRFCVGLGKKVLLADYAGSAASKILDGTLAAQTTLGMWFGVLMFMFEIYFDFSGYSDMAIGMGRMFGFKYPENFRLPYTARSITDFWRRWHISLSTFFRDYVYIPLGGNRRHVYLNLAIVWTLTGLWHGASWNFVLWGVYFLVLLVIERLLRKPIEHIPMVLRHAGTLLLILIGWNIFYYTDTSRLLESFRVLFGASGVGFTDHQTSILMLNSMPLAVLCAICCTPLPRILGASLSVLCATDGHIGFRQYLFSIGMYVISIALFVISVISLTGSSFNAFLYFRF